MDEGTGLTPEAVKELRRATGLALRATKHTARALGRPMAGSVAAERHLWLNLTEISEKEEVFLLDAPISQSGLFGEAVSSVVEKFRSANTQSTALKQFMPRRTRDHSTASSSLSREQSLPRKEPSGGSGAQATHPPPTTVWGARGWSFPHQRPRRRVDMKRPYRPAASANLGRSWPLGQNEESRFTATRRGQTAKAFLPASNVLSSLKTVTATPRGLACRTSSSSFILGLAVGGRVVFPPLQSVLWPPAGRVCGDTVGSPLQRSDPVLANCQSSTSHSINPDKDAKGSPSWRRVPLLPPHDSVQLHTSVWGKSPPPRRGSTDGSKQRLQGFCSTAIAFLPPTERSARGNTAVGHRTRVLQPKGDGGLRPILDLRRLNFSLYKGKFKMLTIKTIMSQIQEGDWFVTIDLKDAYFHIQVVQRHRRFLRFAFGGKGYQYKVLPFGLALAPRTFTKCMDAALAPLRLQGIRVLNYLDDWLILAHSRELVSRHRDIVLRHIHSLGLRMNAKKSVLLPSQQTLSDLIVWIENKCN